jgi:hypothetical protein
MILGLLELIRFLERVSISTMRRTSTKDLLTASQSDLAVSFYDTAVDYPRESFAMIVKRVVPKGFGKAKTSNMLKREAKKMFDLVRR